MSVSRNIQVRQSLEVAIELMQDSGFTKEEINKAMLRACGHQCAEPERLSTMTAQEAKAFASKPMPFGKYMHELIGEVPRDYLEWLADENLQLQRYLRATEADGP